MLKLLSCATRFQRKQNFWATKVAVSVMVIQSSTHLVLMEYMVLRNVQVP